MGERLLFDSLRFGVSEIRPMRPMKDVNGSNEVATLGEGDRVRNLTSCSRLDRLLVNFDPRRRGVEVPKVEEEGRFRVGVMSDGGGPAGRRMLVARDLRRVLASSDSFHRAANENGRKVESRSGSATLEVGTLCEDAFVVIVGAPARPRRSARLITLLTDFSSSIRTGSEGGGDAGAPRSWAAREVGDVGAEESKDEDRLGAAKWELETESL